MGWDLIYNKEKGNFGYSFYSLDYFYKINSVYLFMWYKEKGGKF